MSKKYRKPILCLDFDGVIHSYTSGWKGASVIPDEPVDGALEFIVKAMEHFQVAILSSRSHQWGGKRAMKQYLYYHFTQEALEYSATPDWLMNWIGKTAFADPWKEEVEYAAKLLIKEIKWPWFKPPAMVTIDDRALCFTGEFPAMARLQHFQPWNKR